MRHFNLKEKTLQEVKDGVGSGAINLIEDIVPKDTSKEDIYKIYRVYQDHYDKHSNDHTGPLSWYSRFIKTFKRCRI